MNRLTAIAAVFSLSSAADDAMPTLWELLDELFALDLGDYDHLSFSQSTLIGMRGIIIALFVGAIIGSVSALFNKRVLGGFVRALIAEGCTSPDKAKTLAELGFLKNTAVRASLRAGSVLGKTVRCVEEDEYNAATVAKRGIYELRAAESGKDIPPFREIPYKRDTSTAHFYIPSDRCDSAEIRFSKKVTDIVTFILGVIASVVLLILVLHLLPDLLQLLDNFIGGGA